jgi:hypothetical protein
MARVIRPQEFTAVTSLPGPKRYEYFVKRVADSEEVWSLKSPEGWVMAADDEGLELFPVWSDADYASACREGAWSGSEPGRIPLEEWIDDWLPGLETDTRNVAVFPVRAEMAGVAVEPRLLLQDLRGELDRY